MTMPKDDYNEGGSRARAVTPGREARASPRPRRFYETVEISEVETGFAITLDKRAAKTPNKSGLILMTKELAQAVGDEWQAQGVEIHAETMPLTRLANTVIDAVIGNEVAVRDDIVAYAGSDLVCYRAETPEGLVAAQAEAWDGVLDWAADQLKTRFNTTTGIVHIAQPEGSAARVGAHLLSRDAWELTAIHQMTTLTGSALLALGCAAGVMTAEEAWQAAHVDEDWEISRWGEDAEASMRRKKRWADMQAAERLLMLHKGRPG